MIGGTLPAVALEITRLAQSGAMEEALEASARLHDLWDLMASHGSLRVTATIAEHLGLVTAPSLPRPIRGLGGAEAERVADIVDRLGLGDQG